MANKTQWFQHIPKMQPRLGQKSQPHIPDTSKLREAVPSCDVDLLKSEKNFLAHAQKKNALNPRKIKKVNHLKFSHQLGAGLRSFSP